MKPLTIYKASAGSGKTFTLAVEYIKLLIDNPTAYKNILAVTFTNKATEEMKMRILSQLYGIWKQLPDSSDYVDRITAELGVTPEQASQRAQIALSNLVHDFSNFRVETIDSFFQSVLRNLARELDLTANLRIELNDKQIEQKAVDELIADLDTSSTELGWIINYIRDNIEDDKTWNIIGQIKTFGENIFKDVYKHEHKHLDEVLHREGFFASFVEQLRKIRRQAQDELKSYGEQFQKAIDQYGLDENHFAQGKRGVAGYFAKLRAGEFETDKLLNSYVVKALESPDNWLKKADQTDRSPVRQAVNEKLYALLLSAERRRPKLLRSYKSAGLTLQYMNPLRLLNSIDDRTRNIVKATNRFLLSDTQNLLNALIQDSDSPFIFEKIGSQIKHVMIDEFQDTSTVQWKNFKVLLKECMSHAGSRNLIVGDVKQSIYRWRSGDWRLLNDIEQEFNSSQIDTIPLKKNYRSANRIIDFNNAFFQLISQSEYDHIAEKDPNGAQELRHAYADVVQKKTQPQENDQGLVHIELLPASDYQQRTFQKIQDVVCSLLAQGVNTTEIAILVRSNKTIQDIADYFMSNLPEVKIVSDEAFRLDASLAVNTLIKSLQALIQPDNLLVRAELAKIYQTEILQRPLTDADLLCTHQGVDSLLPQSFVNEASLLVTQPLYNLTEQLYRIFNLQTLTDQGAYVCAFYDQLTQFLSDNVADIESFLHAWDDGIGRITIQSDSADGIRLTTIHKSKGLEFEHVIMPFCDWTLEKSNLIWCKPTPGETPFCELPLIPITFSAKKMTDTVYEGDYLHEHLQNTVDNLNLLYVAFTRPRQSLYVIGRRNAGGTRSKTIEDILPTLAAQLTGSSLEGNADSKDDDLVFSYGHSTCRQEETIVVPSQNIFKVEPKAIQLRLESFAHPAEFRQSNKSREFCIDNEEELSQQNYIHIGKVLHAIFSKIRTRNDIDQVLSQLENDGVLFGTDISQPQLSSMLAKRFSNKTVADWFSDRWELFNECSILHFDPTENKVVVQRPDRVMTDGHRTLVVDFKFGTPKAEYQDQVRRYMLLLEDMGYHNPEGYLWYVYSNVIEPVRT